MELTLQWGESDNKINVNYTVNVRRLKVHVEKESVK